MMKQSNIHYTDTPIHWCASWGYQANTILHGCTPITCNIFDIMHVPEGNNIKIGRCNARTDVPNKNACTTD